MYFSVGVVFLIALVTLSPVIWLTWWAMAEFGSRAEGSYADRYEDADRGHWHAA